MDIQIEQLTKKYDTQMAVDHISFEAKTGEILGFLGPNGAGKSTTMKMITGYIGIGAGDIRIGGQSVKEYADQMKTHIGYLPENNPLYLDMPVIDYLQFCAALQGVNKADIPPRVHLMILQCGLNSEKHKNIGELSKGYRQRVGLAQAMIHDPDILILDEPTTGLDPNQIIEIRQLIKRLGKEKTVILSTHILPEVEATCDRILIINKGKLVANGTAASLREQMAGSEILKVKIEEGELPQIQNILLKIPEISEVKILEENRRLEVTCRQGEAAKRAIFQCCVAQNWILTELIPIETRLEDIFHNLTLN